MEEQYKSTVNCLYLTIKFDVADSVVQRLERAYRDRYDFYWHMGAILADALPAATNDSYGYQRQLNPGWLGSSLSP